MSSPWWAVCLVYFAAAHVHAAKILGIFPFPSDTHQETYRALTQALAAKGHDVTVVTTHPVQTSLSNYKQIDVSFTQREMEKVIDFNRVRGLSSYSQIAFWLKFSTTNCEVQLRSNVMQQFIRSGERKYDLVILEALFYPCYYGLVHHVGSPPMVGITPGGMFSHQLSSMGSPNNPSYMPCPITRFTDHMTFGQRAYNTLMTVAIHLSWNGQYLPEHERISKRYIGSGFPSVHETDRNYSLFITNNHWATGYPLPYGPNIIEVTGIHIKQENNKLPQDIQTFVEDSPEGVIYVNLGTRLTAKELGKSTLKEFTTAFSALRQKVLWRFDPDELPDIPGNVLASKDFCQQDVLAQKNVRLFITYGSLNSFQEASHHAVPMIVIPFTTEHEFHAVKIETSGIGVKLMPHSLNEHSILKAVETVWNNPGYQKKMDYFSVIYRDHPEPMLDRAVWWVEYIIRHDGARHLRSAALDLHWAQLLLLDVIAFLLTIVSIILYALWKILAFLFKKITFTRTKLKQM